MTIESTTQGATYEIIAHSDDPIYIIINNDNKNNVTELFVRMDSKEFFEIINLVTRLVSMSLRAGVDPLVIAKELQTVYSMTTQHVIPKTTILCPSIIARIGIVLEEHVHLLRRKIECQP